MVRTQDAHVFAEKIEQGQYSLEEATSIARSLVYESRSTLNGMVPRQEGVGFACYPKGGGAQRASCSCLCSIVATSSTSTRKTPEPQSLLGSTPANNHCAVVLSFSKARRRGPITRTTRLLANVAVFQRSI